MTIDGAFTSNDPKDRAYALERAKKAIDISQELETDLLELWLAREGTYLREAKDAYRATQQLLETINALLNTIRSQGGRSGVSAQARAVAAAPSTHR